jgi:hypothetical protein
MTLALDPRFRGGDENGESGRSRAEAYLRSLQPEG